MSGQVQPFWLAKTLEDMTGDEWESLCDGCGRCCLVKLQDEDTEIVYYTDVACALFDAGSCRCADYVKRQEKIPDCVRLTPELAHSLTWLPPTCAYRLIAEKRGLPDWHPLVSGSLESVHEAGVSVQGRVGGHEHTIAEAELPHRLVDWPMQTPKGRENRNR